MATRNQRKTARADYRQMIKFLRGRERGFDAKQGYRLNRIAELTPAQKQKLTRHYKKYKVPKKKTTRKRKPRTLPLAGPEYAEKLRTVRQYAKGFESRDGYNLNNLRLTRTQKFELTRVYNIIDRLSSRPTHFYSVRGGEKIQRALQESAQHDKYYKELKGAFFPVGTEDKDSELYEYDDGSYSIVQAKVERLFIPIAPVELALDPEGAIMEALEGVEAKTYSVAAGEYQVDSAADKATISEVVARYVEKYGTDEYDPDDKNSSYYGNWLRGIIANNYQRHENMARYIAAKAKARQELKLKRRREKRKRQKKSRKQRLKKRR